MPAATHAEGHRLDRIGWLRAAVLGANDGLCSTASLLVGVAAAASERHTVLLAGLSGLVAGAMSMAAGEYVSVSSQADAERADLAREAAELSVAPQAELDELAAIYAGRGLSPGLAEQVARELMAADPLGAHARDELGIFELTMAKPLQAALASAASFAAGAALPLAVAVASPPAVTAATVSVASLIGLALLGAIGARAGGADVTRGALRVTFWGAAAMLITAAIGLAVGRAL